MENVVGAKYNWSWMMDLHVANYKLELGSWDLTGAHIGT